MKKILIVLLIILLASGGILYYVMNKPHKDVRDEETTNIKATQLFIEFSADESSANARYLNKALEVNGEISIIDENQDKQTYIVLKTTDDMYGIMCTMQSRDITNKVGDNVHIKGYCSGFVGDVKLTDCVIAKP